MTALILASQSVARARLLSAAGVAFEAAPAHVDEAAVKDSLLHEGAKPLHIAEVLAELKAQRVSIKRPGCLVLGCDQVLDCEGTVYDKPASLEQAKAHLLSLSGKWHTLPTMAVVALNGEAIWRQGASPRLKMRVFSADFVDGYLSRAGGAVLSSVGAYQVEHLGAQLFERIDGDYFSVLGLPLLPVLDFLRVRGLLPR